MRSKELIGTLVIIAGLVLTFAVDWPLGLGVSFIGFIWFLAGRFTSPPD